MNNETISNLFDSYFSVIPANSEKLIEIVYNIRHQVYCEELGYEEQRSDEQETDEHDPHSLHCLLFHKSSQTYAGCVRLVLADNNNPSTPLPLENIFEGNLNSDFSTMDEQSRSKYGEISRLAITAKFRRRRGESSGISIDASNGDERRRFPSIALGLYIAITAMGLKQGLDGVFAMMEPRLARQLHRFGFHFDQIGEAVEHRGLRAPFFISRTALFDNLKPEFLELLNNIQTSISEGTPHHSST